MAGLHTLGQAQGATWPWLVIVIVVIALAAGAAIILMIQQKRHRQRVRGLLQKLEDLEARVRKQTADIVSPNDNAPGEGEGAVPPPDRVAEDDLAQEPTAEDEPGQTAEPPQLQRSIRGRISELLMDVMGDEPTLRGVARQSLMFLSTHVEEKITVARLAKAMAVSPRTLQRQLKELVGCNPKELICAVKMREAKYLLKSSEWRVNEVAYRLGFESPEHFSRRFKTFYQISPSEIVNQSRADA